MKRLIPGLFARSLTTFTLIFSLSCKHDIPPGFTILKKWESVPLQANFEVPAPGGRNEEGELFLELRSDFTLIYDFHIHNLTGGDQLTGAHIHLGDAGSSGNILINLAPVFNGAAASGKVTGLRPGQVDTLLNQPVYINVHSTQVPSGLARGQLDKNIEFAIDLELQGNQEIPPVNTSASGHCILRMTDDKMLYSKIQVEDLESNDTLTAAHLHKAGAGINGPVRIFLAAGLQDFGIVKKTELVDSLYQMLKTESMYANVHSRRHGSGLMRAQIR